MGTTSGVHSSTITITSKGKPTYDKMEALGGEFEMPSVQVNCGNYEEIKNFIFSVDKQKLFHVADKY